MPQSLCRDRKQQVKMVISAFRHHTPSINRLFPCHVCVRVFFFGKFKKKATQLLPWMRKRKRERERARERVRVRQLRMSFTYWFSDSRFSLLFMSAFKPFSFPFIIAVFLLFHDFLRYSLSPGFFFYCKIIAKLIARSCLLFLARLSDWEQQPWTFRIDLVLEVKGGKTGKSPHTQRGIYSDGKKKWGRDVVNAYTL